MSQQSNRFDFGDTRSPSENFTLYENIILDRGSSYSVSIGAVRNREDIKIFLKALKTRKNYVNATHHSWAARIAHGGVVYETKADDGEIGAGMVILRIMQKEDITNSVICVTRWFGGIKLMGDRFKHLQSATKYAIDRL